MKLFVKDVMNCFERKIPIQGMEIAVIDIGKNRIGIDVRDGKLILKDLTPFHEKLPPIRLSPDRTQLSINFRRKI